MWVADPAEPEVVEAGPDPPPQAALTLPEALALRRRLLDDAWLFDDDTAYATGVEDALAACAAVPGFQPLRRALRVPADELALAEESPLGDAPPPRFGQR